MRNPASSKKKRDENGVLRTEREIALYRKRERARRESAERREAEAQAREAEARVRHINLALIERIVMLVLVTGVTVALLVGADTEPLKTAIGAGGLGGVLAVLLTHWRHRS